MSEISYQKPATLDSIASMIERLDTRLTTRIDSLDTKVDSLSVRMDSVETNLTDLIDGLAIATKNQFDRVSIRLDEMNDNLVKFKEETDVRFNGIQNQLDNMTMNYTMRIEHVKLDGRVKRLERVGRI